MILGGITENQHVIPRWLSYRDAIASGELASPISRNISFAHDFDTQLAAFRRSPTPLFASDLLGLAYLDGRPEAIELARYLTQTGQLRKPTERLAQRILGDTTSDEKPEKSFALKIAQLKTDLRKYPRNAMKWVDIARYYTASGQNRSAEHALRVAVALAPRDRFCVRALCRFYIHMRDYGAAFAIFQRNPELLKDPWLLAPAASVAALAEKQSPLPKHIALESHSEIEAFHRSELLEAFGTLELMNGKDRSARKALRAAWLTPTHNVITHAQWVTRHAIPGLRSEVRIDFSKSSQAAAQECVERGELDPAKQFIELWKQEEPYSSGPYVLDSYINCMIEDFSKVISIYDDARTQGLLSAMLMNNAAVAHACLGNSNEAWRLIRELKRTPGSIPEYTLMATEGLLEFARGNLAEGTSLYREAEEKIAKASTWGATQVFLNKLMELHRFNHPIESRDKRRFEEVLLRTPEGFHLGQLLRNIKKLETARSDKQL